MSSLRPAQAATCAFFLPVSHVFPHHPSFSHKQRVSLSMSPQHRFKRSHPLGQSCLPIPPPAQRAPSPRGTLFHKGDAVRPPAKLKALALPCNCIKAGEAAAAAALRSVVAMKRGKGDRRASIGCWRRARLASYTTPREIPRCQVVQLQLQARPAIQRRCVCVRSGGGQRESPHDDPVL
mmetsp:Transcript_55565/g.131946  ORF Transcript_55565/g.131946 Transcript_55565/m.131946 type:complete len:179 (+) Transcript_55565:140-676(+)